MPAKKKRDSRLARAGVSGFNKPKRTPSHPKKSHIVVAKVGDKIKTIRFGQQGAKTAGKPKAGESRATKMKRKSFKARHRKNIAKGKMSAAYWANRVKWQMPNKKAKERKRRKRKLAIENKSIKRLIKKKKKEQRDEQQIYR